MPNDQTQTKQIMIPNDNYFSPAAWNVMVSMANIFIKSSALPKHITNASQLLMILQTGKEMGLKPMQAINGIYILNGKVALYSHVMLSKVLEGGVKLKWLKDTPTEAEVEFSGLDRDPYIAKFTIAEAQKAGLVKVGGAWTTYPSAMLRARAISSGARVFCPDLISGAYTLEEVADVDVDANGNETMKSTKDLDVKPVDPNHAIRLQIKNAILALGMNPAADDIFEGIQKITGLDLHDPANFPAILVKLGELIKTKMQTNPGPNQPEPPKTPETSPNPPKPTPESAPGTAIIEEVDQVSAPATSAPPDPETTKGAVAFDRALAPKAGERYITLIKSLLTQKQNILLDDLQGQLGYIALTHDIEIEKLEDLTHDEAKMIVEKLTNTKSPEVVSATKE